MLPYEKLLTITKSEEDEVIELPFPSRSFLTRLAIVDEASADTSTVDVFSRHPDDFDPALEPIYRVMDQLTLVTGKVEQRFEGRPFVSQVDPDARLVKSGKLFIRVNGTSTPALVIVATGYSDMA